MKGSKKKKKKKQRAIMLREYKHRHAIVRGKKWDKIILCEIHVGPTGHISDKTSMMQHVNGSQLAKIEKSIPDISLP